jgi:hypothetical protein
VAGGWKRLQNEELHNLYASQNIIMVIKSRKMRWEGQIVRTENMRNVYIILVGKPEGKRPLRRRRCRWEHDNRMDLGK